MLASPVLDLEFEEFDSFDVGFFFPFFVRFLGLAGAVGVVRIAVLTKSVPGCQYDDDGCVVVGAYLASGLVGRCEGAFSFFLC